MSQMTRGRDMRSQGIRRGGGVWVYVVVDVSVFCFVRWERERDGERLGLEVERVSADLRDSVLSSSGGFVVVDLRLRERERTADCDCDCRVGESERVREDAVADVGVSGTRFEVEVGGLVDSGGGNGRGWWRVETIVALEVGVSCAVGQCRECWLQLQNCGSQQRVRCEGWSGD